MTEPVDTNGAVEQLRRIQRARDVFRSTRFGLSLTALLGLTSFAWAVRTAPREHLYVGIAAWFFGQVVIVGLVVLGLWAWRRRRFPGRPSTRIPRRSDAMLHVTATAGGVLALIWFGPSIGRTTEAWVICGLGLVLAIAGLRTAWLYVAVE